MVGGFNLFTFSAIIDMYDPIIMAVSLCMGLSGLPEVGWLFPFPCEGSF